MRFAKAKINKLRVQYLGESIYWSIEVKNVLLAVDLFYCYATTWILDFQKGN
jgi:hypothetical protein